MLMQSDWFNSPLYWVIIGVLIVGLIVLLIVRRKQAG